MLEAIELKINEEKIFYEKNKFLNFIKVSFRPKAQITLSPNATELIYVHLEPRKGKTIIAGTEVILKTVLTFPKENSHPEIDIPFSKTMKLKVN